jgi:hypothetical protein
MAEVALAEAFRLFAAGAARDGAVTYAAICNSVAEDAELLELAAEAAPAQRRPNLLLAAVHYLLLGGAGGALAGHYDTVAPPGAASPTPASDLAADFKSFCLEHRHELLELIARRSTQTNEVGRCAALLPALCTIAAAGETISLLDLGTSAGLNLLFDQYGYLYRQRDGTAQLRAGDPVSAVTLECQVRTRLEGLPPLDAPSVAGRVGLDAHPIDPTSDDGARWLLACLWPDNLPRFTRFQAALQIARSTSLRPTIVTGDIVDDLGTAAAATSPGNPLVVFHSWVAAYLTEERQGELVEAVRLLGHQRRVHYLYAEAPAETPGLPTPPSPQPRPTSHLATALVHLDLDPQARSHMPVRLADMHPHGNWISWWP